MAAVPLADAARLLGKPERTIRRWAAQGKLPATRTADGWLVDLAVDDVGQVAATDRTGGHVNGHVAAAPSATGGQVAAVPVSYLHDLQARAEAAAYWQGRASVLEARVQQLEGQLALPAPQPAQDAPGGDSDAVVAKQPQRPAGFWHRLRTALHT